MANFLTTPASINLSGLQTVSNAAISVSNLLLATPNTAGYQPMNPVGTTSSVGSALGLNNILNLSPKSLVFHYEGEQTVSLESDITDHYIENNSALQDQISIRPVLVTTHGFIGELNDVPPAALALLQTLSQKLTTISGYAPGLSVTALNAYNTAFQAYQTAQSVANSLSSTVSSLFGTKTQNLQQAMFNQFYSYWQNRILFTVQTPWTVFNNMAIYKLRAIQSEETNVITDFEVTFKAIQTAQTLFSNPVQSSIAATQSASASMIGTQTAQPGGPSVAAALAGVQ